MLSRFPLTLTLTLALLIAACGSDDDKPVEPAEVAVGSAALAAPIMVDPALDGLNLARAGLAAPSLAGEGLPPVPRSPEAIAAAIAEATRLAGGSIRSAPPAVAKPARVRAVAATQVAEGAPGRRGCKGVEYSAIWAARLPEPLAVYPRGHVQEAAGTDSGGCALRVVNFVTPVGVPDVIDFYYTRLSTAGYGVEHRREGDDAVLVGAGGGAAYMLRVRKREDGITEADLVSNRG